MVDIGSPPLRRSRERRVVAGVLGGIAEHYDLNVTILRVVYVIGSIASAAFPGTIVYIVLWLLIPARKPGEPTPVRA
ncbi:MAG: PspC domain-containing protein [Gemmatimonadetes bacterium]|nr:PspC domain-containing protein [Gemmatimonadota bacterium]